MAKLLKLRRGTDTQHSTFTGAEGEVTVNTTNDSLHVHDGTTAGGREVARADLSNVSGATTGGNITIGGNLSLQDNNKALFGTGNDLEIFHDGTHSYIKDEGTGGLRVTTNGTDIALQKGVTENLAKFIVDGACELYHDSSLKLTTTSTGIDVTGSVACDGLSCVGSATIESGEGILVLKDTDNANSTNHQTYLSGRDSSNTERWYVGNTSSASAYLNVYNTGGAGVRFGTSNTARCEVDANGHFVPATTNAYDIGGASLQWRNAYFDGTVNCDGLVCEGEATITASTGILNVKDSDSSGNATNNFIRGQNSNGAARWTFGQIATNTETLYVSNESDTDIAFRTNGTTRAYLQNTGHFIPASTNTYDLGASSYRWRNVYTNDLNLSNEGGTNDVDGTWGSWTIQEGEDDLFLLNRRNGKKYKFNLSEVN